MSAIFQVTEFRDKNKVIDTEYGKMPYFEWIEHERKRIGGWTLVIPRNNQIALFYKKDRRKS